MTQKYQNLTDYLKKNGMKVIDLYRLYRKKCKELGSTPVSACVFYTWTRFDAIPTKKSHLDALTALTGMTAENLFNEE